MILKRIVLKSSSRQVDRAISFNCDSPQMTDRAKRMEVLVTLPQTALKHLCRLLDRRTAGSLLCLILALLLGAVELQAQQVAPAVPAATGAPLDPLDELVDRAIAATSNRYLDTQVHTPWQILHGLLSLRENYVIKDKGVPVRAIDWISQGATFRGTHWFEATRHGGRAHPYNGTPYEFEGHVNQSLSIIAMCNLPLEHEFVAAGGKRLTMQQMVDHAKFAIDSKAEVTWTLWFLTTYLDQDEEWINEKDEPWSMERLVRTQVQASPYNAPCGGTHGMFALAYARNSYLRKHGQLRGAWLEADQKLQRYLLAAQRMQNRDGSFATNWFKSTGYSNEFNERIKYSGHMLEWIIMALPRQRLKEQWVRAGIQALCYDLIRNAHEPAECGPLYHALHALVLYRQQTNPNRSPLVEPSIARQTPTQSINPSSEPEGRASTGATKPDAAPEPAQVKVAEAEPKQTTLPQIQSSKNGTKNPEQASSGEQAAPLPTPTNPGATPAESGTPEKRPTRIATQPEESKETTQLQKPAVAPMPQESNQEVSSPSVSTQPDSISQTEPVSPSGKDAETSVLPVNFRRTLMPILRNLDENDTASLPEFAQPPADTQE